MAQGDNIDKWQWQEPGQAWKGRGIYHVTLTQTDRTVPLMGTLEIPDGNAEKARVLPSTLGGEIIGCMRQIEKRHPEVEVWASQIMPDHIHFVLHVKRRMEVGIMTVVRGFWQGCKASYRKWLAALSPLSSGAVTSGAVTSGSVTSDNIRHNGLQGGQLGQLGRGGQLERLGYHYPANLFEQMPKVVAMSHRGHLKIMMRYVHDNPRRLAFKRLYPAYFRITRGITIGGLTFDAVGNLMLLNKNDAQTVHVHKELVWLAEGRSSGCNARAQRDAEAQGYRGDPQPLRDYMNGCILVARKGAVSVSPFISPHEQKVRDVLLKDYVVKDKEPVCHPIIYLADNGFPQFYKPGSPWTDAVANGHCLILAPTVHEPGRLSISREQCRTLNAHADAVVNALSESGVYEE